MHFVTPPNRHMEFPEDIRTLDRVSLAFWNKDEALYFRNHLLNVQ